MRKVIVSEYVSLDGVLEDPGGAEKFEHGGWTVPYWSDEIGQFKFAELAACDALLLGRVTYQGFAAAWPGMEETTGDYGKMMNSYAKYVVSKTLKDLKWNNSSLVKGSLEEGVSKLKQQSGKDIMVFGSGQLAQALTKHHLVDQYNILVYPVVLGSGKRLFRDVGKTTLKLVDTKPFGSGVVALTYQPSA